MLQAAVAAVVWVHSPQKSIQWDHLNLMMKDFYGNGSGLYQMTLLPSTGHEWLWWWVWWYESHVGRATFYKQICAQNKPGIRFSVPFWYLLYKLCWLSWFFGFFYFFFVTPVIGDVLLFGDLKSLVSLELSGENYLICTDLQQMLWLFMPLKHEAWNNYQQIQTFGKVGVYSEPHNEI